MKTLDDFLDDLIDGHQYCDCNNCKAAKIIETLDNVTHSQFDNYLNKKISKILNGEEGE